MDLYKMLDGSLPFHFGQEFEKKHNYHKLTIYKLMRSLFFVAYFLVTAVETVAVYLNS